MKPYLATVLCVGAIGCSSPSRTTGAATETTTANSRRNPIEVAARVFEGSPSTGDVKAQFDRALTLYGETPSEEMYNRAASTLVALRQNTGVAEMKILDYMIRSHVEDVKLTFPEAAAFAATFLKAGDR